MAVVDEAQREAVGPTYSLAAIRAAQAHSWQVIETIAARIVPGMTTAEAMALGEAVLAESGMERSWHPLAIRLGAETVKMFRDRIDPQAVLGSDDIFFVDIGPVYGAHEGDAGATFVVGEDAEMAACARDVRTIFDRVAAIWAGGGVTGTALYDAATREAEAMGWVLNQDVRGHRVGDYPHVNGGKLGDLTSVPGAGLWILEVQIRHPTRPFGAFHEDLLA